MKNLAILLMSIYLTACGNSLEFKEEPRPPISGNFPITSLNFQTIKNSILDNHCIRCHGGYGDYQAVFNDKDKI